MFLIKNTDFFPTKNHFSPHIFCSVIAPEDYGEVFNSSLSAQWKQLFTKLHLKGSALDRIQQNHPRDSAMCLNMAMMEWLKLNYNYEKFLGKEVVNFIDLHENIDTTYYCSY